mmetsp:Transcript_15062/g.33154  ORF Transcript_15062/g.33154 Transcript_15062/m.33154 type:complete len:378 (-) Transcript_15062:147-1280(-)
MPRKERPAPLADTFFRKLRGNDGDIDCPEAIPVHNTFIQFGAPEGPASGEVRLSTAPAWIGPSLQSAVRAAGQSTVQVPLQNQPTPTTPPSEEHVEEESKNDAGKDSTSNTLIHSASPKKVPAPMTRYSLSASSARAAGLPTGGSRDVVASYATIMSPQNCEQGEDDSDSGDDDDATPSAAPGELPSLGSAKHAEGLCKRCCFFPKGRCQNGHGCEFCHLDHEKRKRKKKKKSARRGTGSDGEDEAPEAEKGAPSSGQEPGSRRPPVGLPLTAPPTLPPRGLPLPTESAPPVTLTAGQEAGTPESCAVHHMHNMYPDHSVYTGYEVPPLGFDMAAYARAMSAYYGRYAYGPAYGAPISTPQVIAPGGVPGRALPPPR